MAERRNSLLDFFTSDTDDDLTYRSSMLPIGTYRASDGRERAGLAWPQLAMDAVDAMEAPGELLFGEGLDRDESQRRASIAAGLMMGGGLAAPRPGNALAMSGGRVVDNALPMDHASRMARAREMGFDVDAPLYHGTQAKFDEFQPSQDGSYGPGVYVTNDRKHAEHFTQNDKGPIGEVLELYTKGPFATWDDVPKEAIDRSFWTDLLGKEGTPASRASDWARNNGYAGFTNSVNGNSVVYDPRNIRSVNATFDPAQANSANLLAANGSKGGAGVGIAEAASNSQGGPLKLYHSTNAKFDTFDNAFTDEVGFHFGSKGTANDRAFINARGNWFDYFKNYRTMPVEADIKNPLMLSEDIGHFNASNLAERMFLDGKLSFDDAVNFRRAEPETRADIRAQNDIMRRRLIDEGYDAVAYRNSFERPGDTSYMLLNTGNVRDPNTGKVLYNGGFPFPLFEDEVD